MHVLVIDDDTDYRHLLSAHLSRKGCEVSTAHDGIQGQRIARVGNPDVITIDYHLTGGSGLVVLDRLRHNAETQTIPVVMLSGSLTDQIIESAENAGACRVLSKVTLTEEALVEALEPAPQWTERENEHDMLFPGESR